MHFKSDKIACTGATLLVLRHVGAATNKAQAGVSSDAAAPGGCSAPLMQAPPTLAICPL